MVQPEEVTDDLPAPVSAHGVADAPLALRTTRSPRGSFVANAISASALLAILAMGIAYVNAGMP